MKHLLFALPFIAGCAMIGAKMMDPVDVAESIKLLEAAKVSGCVYLRGRANPPAAQIELDAVYAFGGNNYQECLTTLRR